MSEHIPSHAIATLQRAKDLRTGILQEVGKRVFGQDDVVELLLIALFARGHTVMMGVPGLAKTLLVSTLSDVLGLSSNRIQFTPDLMPSDITGTDILEDDPETGRRVFRFLRGPVFTNLLLADEINRTPPKTQAALLQAMQERIVTAGGRTWELEPPFLVFATQNPIEQEGTYPLPEAQLDRFMFLISLGYPSREDERRIAKLTTGDGQQALRQLTTREEILAVQQLVLRVEVSDAVVDAAVDLVRATRPEDPTASDDVRRFVSFGAGPRAVQSLVLAAKARAVLHGFETPSVDDIYQLAPSILAHRVLTNFHADADGVTSTALVQRLIQQQTSSRR